MMYCDMDFYMCKNLLYLDDDRNKGYFCTLTCKKCNCQGCESKCSSFEIVEEE